MTRYLTPETGEGVAIEGQPVNQLYHERSLSEFLVTFLRAGLVLDGLEEPAFQIEGTGKPDGGNLPEIPPVLAGRLGRPPAERGRVQQRTNSCQPDRRSATSDGGVTTAARPRAGR